MLGAVQVAAVVLVVPAEVVVEVVADAGVVAVSPGMAVGNCLQMVTTPP